MSTTRKFPDLFVDPEDDPRAAHVVSQGDERATLLEFLLYQRLTMELKCSDLDAEQLARRSVEPSSMSLLGLVRHMAEVERSWFRRRMAQQQVPQRYCTPDNRDGDWDGAVADPAVVEEAWAAWREECAFTDAFIGRTDDLGYTVTFDGGKISLRELLCHMIEEYARHNGHADLLRERIDGRTGE